MTGMMFLDMMNSLTVHQANAVLLPLGVKVVRQEYNAKDNVMIFTVDTNDSVSIGFLPGSYEGKSKELNRHLTRETIPLSDMTDADSVLRELARRFQRQDKPKKIQSVLEKRPLICVSCGAHMSAESRKCEYCGTEYG